MSSLKLELVSYLGLAHDILYAKKDLVFDRKDRNWLKDRYFLMQSRDEVLLFHPKNSQAAPPLQGWNADAGIGVQELHGA